MRVCSGDPARIRLGFGREVAILENMSLDEIHVQTLPGSRIECREAGGRLVLHLPARPGRMLLRLGGLFALFGVVLVVVVFASKGWAPVAVVFGSVATVILSFAAIASGRSHLVNTFVLIAPHRAVVKTILYGKEQVREFELGPASNARQWYLPQRPGGSSAEPQGIEIGTGRYNPEAGSDLSDESRPRFGAGLAPGELDWVEWRINRFLGHSTDADEPTLTLPSGPAMAARLERFPAEALPRPKGNLVRIEEEGERSRIVFPNTAETRSFVGIGSVVFGLAVSGGTLFMLVPLWEHAATAEDSMRWLAYLGLVVLGVFPLLGLAGVLNGLTQLFGIRELTISPESVTYRAALWGMAVWWTIPTLHITSVWEPGGGGRRRGRGRRAIASAQGGVIRTATREVRIGAITDVVRNRADAEWLADEIARRIDAARWGASD